MLHPFEPVFDKHSSILILGTFPSEKSRKYGFFYGHPQNRFWKLLTLLTKSEKIPESIEEKKSLLLKNGIALWDVIHSCDIKGSSDASITNVVPNDLSKILECANIQRIYANGEKVYRIYMKYCYKNIGKDIIKLPSTRPANASYNLVKLRDEWEATAIQNIKVASHNATY